MDLAKEIPVPKLRDSSILSNYRPISLLPIVSKLLESHIGNLISKRLTLSPNQHGFRCGYSTIGALIRLAQTAHDRFNSPQRKVVAGFFFDLAKAFDRVSHSQLLHVLETSDKLPPK